jgi:cyclophilin family peptidyl-prolyl cis-trans isomerase
MCNKRRTFIKNNSINKYFHQARVWFIPFIIWIFIIGCDMDHHPMQQSESFINGYPELETAITHRYYRELLLWIDHDDKHTARLARRAITKTEPDDLEEYIQLGIDHDEPETWYMVSLRPINELQVANLLDRFKIGDIRSDAVCQVFRQLGMLDVAEELSQMGEILRNSYHCSLALGVILSRQKVNELMVREVLNIAFGAEDRQVRKHLLYGLFRSPLNRPEPGSLLQEELAEFYRLTGMWYSPAEDEMLVRIVGKEVLGMVMMKYTDAELREHVQLSVELAANLVHFDGIDVPFGIVRRLLNHRNLHVAVQTLVSLANISPLQQDLVNYVEKEITGRTRNHEIFASSLNLLQVNGSDISRYKNRLDFTLSENPYLADRLFPLYRQILSHTEFMDLIRENINMGGIRGYHAFQALIPVFVDYFEEDGFIAEIRDMVLEQLERGDRSVVHALERFLQNEFIIRPDDFDLMYDFFQNFLKNGEYENAGVLVDVLRFHAPNDFDGSFEIPEKGVKAPDWERLYNLGINPYWILETNRGKIEIRLDPLTAPFTVSSIDSLTRSGKYDGVPFHRVIANFVVQGGDFDRMDGFGGPAYRLPTEPSFVTFSRGSVGVASSGTDTEGSQFFITLNPTPHLDGFYTRFGEVVRGLDVADRIQIGDRVVRARIDIR